MSEKPIVNFFCFGSPKSGSTWIKDCLATHPEIFVPQRSIFYFNEKHAVRHEIPNRNYGKNIQWYHSHFKTEKEARMVGEVNADYLTDPKAAKNIFDYNPDAKLFAIIRNPIKRAFSYYSYFGKQKGFYELNSFDEMFTKGKALLALTYLYKYLAVYYSFFAKNQIKIFLLEDFIEDPKREYKRLLDFLSVSEHYPDALYEKSNVTSGVRIPWLNYSMNSIGRMLHQTDSKTLYQILLKTGIIPFAEYIRDNLNQSKTVRKEVLDEKYIPILKNFYAEDINSLEQLIDRDLSFWK